MVKPVAVTDEAPVTRFLAAALAALLALPAVAVQPAEGERLAEDQSFTFWLPDAVGVLDPAQTSDPEGMDLLRQLFEGLMTEDATGAMIPDMAERHEVSEDGLTHSFQLREARWSNGDPVTADDFVAAWRRVVDPKTGSAHARYLALMQIENAAPIIAGEIPVEQLGVTALDARRLQVTLTRPVAHFAAMLSHPATFPIPPDSSGDDGGIQPGKLIGNGAFTLQAHDPGASITLTKNPAYWDADNVVMETLRGVTEIDGQAALTRFRAGELDRVPIPVGEYPQLREDFPDQATVLPIPCTYAYVFNLSDKGPEALKNPALRRALSLGLERDLMVSNVLQGGQRPAQGWTHWAIAGLDAPEGGPAALDQDARTALARELLAGAGYGPDNPLRLVLQYNGDELHRLLAQAARQYWKPLGVEVSLNNLDWTTHADRMHRQDFEIARYGWCADYNEPSAFLDWFRSDGENSGGWSNDEYDHLLDQARLADDPAPLYRQAEEILAAEAPAAFVYHYATTEMINPAIRGLSRGNAMGRWYGKDLYRLAP